MPTFGKRLHAAMLAAGLSEPSELAGKINVSPQIVRKWLKSKEPNLSARHLLDAAKVLHIRSHWLGAGEGPVHRFHASEYSEAEMLRTFRTLGDREKKLFRDVMGDILKYRED